MIDWKKVGKNILYPHPAVLILLTPISIAFLVFSLIYFDSTNVLALISYLLSFYVLLVFCFKMPNIIAFFKKFKNENKYAKKYFTDVRLRMNISLYGSLVWNIAFAIFQLWLGFKDNSLWFYSMFVYYIFLAAMRFFLVRHTRIYKPAEKEEMELKKHNICAILLLVMNIVLSAIIFFIVYLNKTFEYHMITTIALAAYTFTTFSFAIVNLVRYRKYNSPVFSAAKMITLIAACVSMLTLETTMLTVFGDTATAEFSRLMLGLTGAAVSAVAITMPIIMIVRGRKALKRKTDSVEESEKITENELVEN